MFVVYGEALKVIFDSVETGGGEYSGLSHTSAEDFSSFFGDINKVFITE